MGQSGSSQASRNNPDIKVPAEGEGNLNGRDPAERKYVVLKEPYTPASTTEDETRNEGSASSSAEQDNNAPSVEAMSRSGHVDPVKYLKNLGEVEMEMILKMDENALFKYFSDLTLDEIANVMQTRKFRGEQLSILTKAQIESAGFRKRWERKVFEDLCRDLRHYSNELETRTMLLEKRLPYEQKVHEWNSGPLSELNCCSKKDHNNTLESCCEELWKSSLSKPHQLPPPRIILFEDKIILRRAKWSRVIKPKYKDCTRGFSDSDDLPYLIEDETILLKDITSSETYLLGTVAPYIKSGLDPLREAFGMKLHQDRHAEKYYWEGIFKRSFGHTRYYYERPEGELRLTVRHINSTDGSESFIIRSIPILDGVEEMGAAIAEKLCCAQILSPRTPPVDVVSPDKLSPDDLAEISIKEDVSEFVVIKESGPVLEEDGSTKVESVFSSIDTEAQSLTARISEQAPMPSISSKDTIAYS